MTVVRVVLGAVGVLVGLYGAWLLLDRTGTDQLVSAVVWLGGGVALHDAVLAPVVVVAGVLVARLLPPALRAPLAVVGVVVGSVTLLAVPVIGGFGRRPDNPTLLDRDYAAGWLVVVAVVVVVVGCGTLVGERRRRGTRAGRR
jgi:hypothetical protein